MWQAQPETKNAPEVAATGALSVKNPEINQGINMSNSTVALASRAITVPFLGADLCVIEHDAQPYTPMKPIITGMGLTWHGQHAKIKTNTTRWGVLELRIPSPGGLQDMLCMPLRKLPGWLSGIESGKVKSLEARAKVVQYQNECDDVLWKYWNDGIAVNPRAAYSVNAGDLLTKNEAETLRLMLKSAADRLPKVKQGALMVQGWSKLKSHFGVSYREIPRHEFSEAVSIIARHAAEWEVVDEEPPLATDSAKIKQAFAMASEVAQQAAVTVFNALIDDDDAHKHNRWMFSLSHNRVTNEQDVPWAKPIDHDKMLFSMKDLPSRIVEPNSMIGTREELANIAMACMQKLSGVDAMKMRNVQAGIAA